jgi:hypothetical protein
VLIKIIARALGESLSAEREASQRELYDQVRELNTTLTQVEDALEQLRGVIALERKRTIDLPQLPSRRDLN